MAKSDEKKYDDAPEAVTEEREPEAAPKKPPVEFYAKDRFHAMTHARAVWNVPHDVAERMCTVLDGMTHRGPVRVVVSPDLKVPPVDKDHPAPVLGPNDPIPGDGFVIMPFAYVKV